MTLTATDPITVPADSWRYTDPRTASNKLLSIAEGDEAAYRRFRLYLRSSKRALNGSAPVRSRHVPAGRIEREWNVREPESGSPGGCVYCFTDASGLYKLGRAKDPVARLLDMTTANPTIRKVFAIAVEDAEDSERHLHTRFAHRRVTGEWFELSAGEVARIKRRLRAEK